MAATTADPRADLGHYPTDPLDVTGGRLAAMRRDQEDYSARVRSDHSATAQAERLGSQLAAYRATIDGATPASDMLLIAAAEAGIRVCERALVPIKLRQEREQEGAEAARRAYDEACSTYRRRLGRIPELVLAGRHDEARRMRRDLEELAGPPPA